MEWSETRKLLLSLARGGRSQKPESANELVLGGAGSSAVLDEPAVRIAPRGPLASFSAPRAASLCIASGKGGTGKSVVIASLSSLFSARGKTLVFDADLGVGNAHILQDVSPPHSLVEVVEGECTVRDVLVPCSERCDLVAGGSGFPRMAALNDVEMQLVAEGMLELEGEYRFMLVDSAAGVSKQTLAFARACDQTLVVTTPDLTAMTDAYAFLKVLMGKKPEPTPLLLVNRAHSEEEAQEVVQRIRKVCRRFLGLATRRPRRDRVRQPARGGGPARTLRPERARAAQDRRPTPRGARPASSLGPRPPPFERGRVGASLEPPRRARAFHRDPAGIGAVIGA